MLRCHKGGQEWVTQKRVKLPGVKETCEKCSAYLHCCWNCRFYDPSKHNQCAVPNTEWVVDKEGANFCDEFQFADTGGQAATKPPQEKARNAFESLFGAPEEPSDSERLDKFKDLFGG